MLWPGKPHCLTWTHTRPFPALLFPFKSKKQLIAAVSPSFHQRTLRWATWQLLRCTRFLGLCSCLVVLACCCVGKLRTVATFKHKPPAKNSVLNSNGVQCKALILKTNLLSWFTAKLWASRHMFTPTSETGRQRGILSRLFYLKGSLSLCLSLSLSLMIDMIKTVKAICCLLISNLLNPSELWLLTPHSLLMVLALDHSEK